MQSEVMHEQQQAKESRHNDGMPALHYDIVDTRTTHDATQTTILIDDDADMTCFDGLYPDTKSTHSATAHLPCMPSKYGCSLSLHTWLNVNGLSDVPNPHRLSA